MPVSGRSISDLIDLIAKSGVADKRHLDSYLHDLANRPEHPATPKQLAQTMIRDGMRVLRVSRHGNKLRPGHLHGNRFRILVREVTSETEARSVLPLLIDRLKQQGLPNYYGPQRFGRAG